MAATTDDDADSNLLRPRLSPRLTVSLALSTLELTRSTMLLLLEDEDDEDAEEVDFFLLDPAAELLLRPDKGATGASSSLSSAAAAAFFFALPLLLVFFADPTLLLLFFVLPEREGARSGCRDEERVTRDGVPLMMGGGKEGERVLQERRRSATVRGLEREQCERRAGGVCGRGVHSYDTRCSWPVWSIHCAANAVHLCSFKFVPWDSRVGGERAFQTVSQGCIGLRSREEGQGDSNTLHRGIR